MVSGSVPLRLLRLRSLRTRTESVTGVAASLVSQPHDAMGPADQVLFTADPLPATNTAPIGPIQGASSREVQVGERVALASVIVHVTEVSQEFIALGLGGLVERQHHQPQQCEFEHLSHLTLPFSLRPLGWAILRRK